MCTLYTSAAIGQTRCSMAQNHAFLHAVENLPLIAKSIGKWPCRLKSWSYENSGRQEASFEIKRHNLSTGRITVVFRPCHWKCITGVKNWGKIGEGMVRFWPPVKGFFWGSSLWCKVSSKLSEICDHRRGDRQKDRHTDASDFIICPMLCYSNGTDKKCKSTEGFLQK